MSDTLVILLIFVIGALVLLWFGYSFASELKEGADIEVCRLSVLAQSQFRKIPIIDVNTPKTVVSLDCPRRNIKISEDKVEMNGKKYSKYSVKKLSNDEINLIISEEMRKCWYKMSEGSKDVFEYSYWFVGDKICLICSEIEFDEKLKGKSFTGLLDYIKSKHIPKDQTKYFDYFIKSQQNRYPLYGLTWEDYNPWGYGNRKEVPEDKINSDQKYSIYFLAYKPGLLATPAISQAYYLGIGKESKLAEECEIVVN